MSDSARFALIRLDRASHDPMVLARALAGVRGTPVQDQVLVARRAWGIVADDLSEDEAKALQGALRSAGVDCAVGPVAALARLPPLEVARTLDTLPSGRPVLIAAAGITVTTTTTTTETKGPGVAQALASVSMVMAAGVPLGPGRKRTVEKAHGEHGLAFCSDLCYGAPSRRLRIDASHFDFSCLEERMLYQAQANLKLLLGDLARAAPKAWPNHGTRVLLEGRPIREMGYRSLEDLEREERWLLTLQTIRRTADPT